MRQIITDYYQSSEEPKYVQNAIDMATVNDTRSLSLKGTSTMNTLTRGFNYALYGAKKYGIGTSYNEDVLHGESWKL